MTGVMVVTGASRGIGAATARLAGEQGYAVCVNYVRNEDAANSVVTDITGKGGRAIAVPADVASEAEVVRLFETADKELGPLTALVNNAGILETGMRLDEMEGDRFKRVFATNITGSFLCAREAVRRMSTKRGGKGGGIVNLSSIAARLGGPNEFLDYAATKGAIDTMTIGLANEVADEGIRVNAVRPGLIYTDIHASGGFPDRVDKLKESGIPMKRGGDPEEVARAILWLLSDDASYTTASFVEVAGGR